MIFSTERLFFRPMTYDDFGSLCTYLQDSQVMYAYEHAFSDDEVKTWLKRQIDRQNEFSFSNWAVCLKQTGEMIGQCGITYQDCEGERILEVGYLLAKKYWHKGYATEAAVACKNYAFEVLKADAVYSIIRDTNLPSQAVAQRNGMEYVKTFTKHYYNIDMPHFLYRVKNPNI